MSCKVGCMSGWASTDVGVVSLVLAFVTTSVVVANMICWRQGPAVWVPPTGPTSGTVIVAAVPVAA